MPVGGLGAAVGGGVVFVFVVTGCILNFLESFVDGDDVKDDHEGEEEQHDEEEEFEEDHEGRVDTRNIHLLAEATSEASWNQKRNEVMKRF